MKLKPVSSPGVNFFTGPKLDLVRKPPRGDEPETSAQAVADAISTALQRRGITQRALASAAGVTEGAVSGWVSPDSDKQTLLQWRRLADICRRLGVSADELLGLGPAATGPSPLDVAAAVEHLDKARRLLLAEAQENDALADLGRALEARLEKGNTRAKRGSR